MEVSGAELSAYHPQPSDLPTFLPYACSQLQAPFRVRVLLQPLEEYGCKSADDKGKKLKVNKSVMQPAPPQTASTDPSAEREQPAAAPDDDDVDEIVLRARCDTLGRPAELVFYRCTQLPRLLMKIIGLCIPYHAQLTRITIRWGPLDGFALYEIAKFLPISQITEICLDDSPVSHRNYYLLLEPPSRLQTLSLARCRLADEDVASLAAMLIHPKPASRTLAVLSLEANKVGDVGARLLAEALRTNRSLRHLNLAGNTVTSSGAALLFGTLMPFSVTANEIALKRRRTFEYLKLKQETIKNCYRELISSADAPPDGGRGRRRTKMSRRGSTVTLASLSDRSSGTDALARRAELLAEEQVGAYADPFDSAELVTRDGVTYCAGNFALASIDLAYNNLDCSSARHLARVLGYQAGAGSRRAGRGLVHALLEGNAVPECTDAGVAATLLQRAQSPLGGVTAPRPARRSERAKIKV